MLTGHSLPISIAGIRQWREAIRQGNHAFQIADYTRAVGHYRFACLNLADIFEYLDCMAEQGSQLSAVHEKLCLAMNDPALDEAWRMAVWRHSRRTYAELTRFVNRHGLACVQLMHYIPTCPVRVLTENAF